MSEELGFQYITEVPDSMEDSPKGLALCPTCGRKQIVPAKVINPEIYSLIMQVMKNYSVRGWLINEIKDHLIINGMLGRISPNTITHHIYEAVARGDIYQVNPNITRGKRYRLKEALAQAKGEK